MRKKIIIATIFIFVIAGHFFKPPHGPRVLHAQTVASLKFDPPSLSTANGSQFDVNVVVDTGGAEVLSTDAYIIFDATKIQAVSVQNGTFFPSTTSSIQNSSLVLRGIVTEPASFRKGTGVLGTVTFKALQSGTSSMNFYCNVQAGDTSKIVQNGIDAQNIISCAANTTLTVTSGSGISVTTSPSPGLSPTGPKPSVTRIPDGDGDDDDGKDDDGRDDDGKDDDGWDDDGKDDDGKDDHDGKLDKDGRDNDGKDDDGKDDDGLDDDGKDDDGKDDDGWDDDGIPDAKVKGNAKVNLLVVSVAGGALIAGFFFLASRKV